LVPRNGRWISLPLSPHNLCRSAIPKCNRTRSRTRSIRPLTPLHFPTRE
jgi:hypothetical protein